MAYDAVRPLITTAKLVKERRHEDLQLVEKWAKLCVVCRVRITAFGALVVVV